MDDFEKAILFTFDQTGSVGPDIKTQSQVRWRCDVVLMCSSTGMDRTQSGC